MVLFKFIASIPLYLDNEFTFHYGPIQIFSVFIFHFSSGCDIYIPLWSYSNRQKKPETICQTDIYIPLWSYSNDSIWIIYLDLYSFTFHYGPIQILTQMTNDIRGSLFTFHYGPIQIIFHLA